MPHDRVVSHKPQNPLHLIRDPYLRRTHGQTGHIRTFPAQLSAVPDPHIQLAQRPIVLAEKIIIILPEDGMDLRPPGT